MNQGNLDQGCPVETNLEEANNRKYEIVQRCQRAFGSILVVNFQEKECV